MAVRDESRGVGAAEPMPKLGARIATEIEREIVERGWVVGSSMGSEPELLERYDVSRAVLREAIRLLEHPGVATMRRGPAGGLIVTAPDGAAAAHAMAVFLQHRQV